MTKFVLPSSGCTHCNLYIEYTTCTKVWIWHWVVCHGFAQYVTRWGSGLLRTNWEHRFNKLAWLGCIIYNALGHSFSHHPNTTSYENLQIFVWSKLAVIGTKTNLVDHLPLASYLQLSISMLPQYFLLLVKEIVYLCQNHVSVFLYIFISS